jgi:hypothetical protein
MKFTIVPAFYNKPDYLQNLWFYQGHLEVWLRSLLFSYTTVFPGILFAKQILQVTL